MRNVLRLFCLTALSLIIVTTGFSQRLTGSLEGKVLDQDGTFLPGATVSIASPALLGTRSFITTGNGSFRFPSLSPGEYSITCELSEFKTMKREGIVIRVGMTTTINFTMEQSAIEEEITVTAESPVIDVKSSQKGISFTKELIENIPLNRDLFNILTSAPGVVAESGFGGGTHGASVLSNQFSIDGLNFSNPITNRPLYTPDLASMEEIEIQTGAHPADIGSVPGAYINIVTRSGGNAFHGDATAYYFGESLVDENFTEEQLDAFGLSGASFDKRQMDMSFNVGGPILRDKLWFFGSGRYYDIMNVVSNFPEDTSTTRTNGLGKLTFQLTDAIKLVGYYNYELRKIPYSGASPLRTVAATLDIEMTAQIANFQMNWILSPNAFLDIRSIYYEYGREYRMGEGHTHPNYDRGTGIGSGGRRWHEDMKETRLYFSAGFTLFADDFLGGNHELKIGAETERTSFDQDVWMPDPIHTFSWNGSPYYYGNFQSAFYAYGMGSTEGEGVHLFRGSGLNFYINDRWTIKDRLTLNLGLRYDTINSGLPAQNADAVPEWQWLDPVFFGSHEFPEAPDLIKLSKFSPRLGLVFDVFGNGKTVAKASFSRVLESTPLAVIFWVNPNTYSKQVYLWKDLDQDAELDQTDSFTLLGQDGRSTESPYDRISPDLTASYWDEFIIGVDHEVLPDFRLGLSYIYKTNKNIIESQRKNAEQNWSAPITVTDPGYDGEFGTGDDSQLTVWDRTGPIEDVITTNPAGAFRKYSGLEFVLEKRMSNNWQFLGSVVYSKSYGTIGQGFGESGMLTGAFDTPNWLVNREGRSSLDRPLVIKLQGTYKLPYGILLSGSFISFSGTPYARAVNVFAPNVGSYVTVNAEAPGTRRTPSQTNLDLRVEKELGIGDFGKLGLFVDVYNVFNAGYLSLRSNLHGFITPSGSFSPNSQWNRILSTSGPRFIKLGVRFRF